MRATTAAGRLVYFASTSRAIASSDLIMPSASSSEAIHFLITARLALAQPVSAIQNGNRTGSPTASSGSPSPPDWIRPGHLDQQSRTGPGVRLVHLAGSRHQS